MLKITRLSFLLFLCLFPAVDAVAQIDARMLRYPAVSRDRIAFVYAGDVWLVAKDGAEGVFAAALPDGGAVAVKVLDGAARPLPVVVSEALRALGADVPEELGRRPVLGGGEPVGEVRAVLR